jgi:hypothetical protein
MPTHTERVADYATWLSDSHRITGAFDTYAREEAQRAHPKHRDIHRAAEEAEQRWRQVRRKEFDVRSHYDSRLMHYGALGYADDLDQRLDRPPRPLRQARATQMDRRPARRSRRSVSHCLTVVACASSGRRRMPST